MRLIGLFDRVCLDRLFERSERGETIFLPFGRFGQRYLLPTEREPAIRRVLRVQAMASIIAGLSFVFLGAHVAASGHGEALGSWLFPLSWFAVLTAIFVYSRWSLARGLSRVLQP